jgi:hypothetical protein
MDTNFLLMLLIAVIVSGFAAWLIFVKRKVDGQEKKENRESNVLKLQAYERLILLADRIALPNLISRLGNQFGFSARDMQLLLTQNIKQEFEYNVTQQMYVSEDAWTAIKNLKEQNILIINQLTSMLPAEASGIDLSKLVLEFLVQDNKGRLHEVVSEVLSIEAKKLM